MPVVPRAVALASLPGALLLAASLSPARTLAQPGTPRTRVEGVAAWVGGTARGVGGVPVLRSDVELRARIHIGRRTGHVEMGPLPPALLAAALDEIVGEVLIEREADRLRAARPSEADVERERERLDEEAGGERNLSQLVRLLGADPEELVVIAQRRAYVDAFLRANLEGSTVISDAQVQRAFDAGEHPFVGRPFEEVREVMRVWLAQRVLSRDVARWIEVLRGRTTVRVLAEWQSDG